MCVKVLLSDMYCSQADGNPRYIQASAYTVHGNGCSEMVGHTHARTTAERHIGQQMQCHSYQFVRHTIKVRSQAAPLNDEENMYAL